MISQSSKDNVSFNIDKYKALTIKERASKGNLL